MKPLVLIFTKAPRLGAAKSRLAAGIGVVHAWRIKRRLDRRTCRVLADPRWDLAIACARDRDLCGRFGDVWPARLPRTGQGSGDLGARMARALATQSRGGRKVLIVGSDVARISRAAAAEAVAALNRADVVIGPSGDGGYWLIGAHPRAARCLTLAPVRWSGPHTLQDTLASLPVGTRVNLIRALDDVDTRDDLRLLRGARQPLV
ncbi:MAG: TIGR04282 family arsenosugar biosynthesis glycosyltransferase [Hyphomonadaceae bacterium]|nr:TIGR04282 family arsenosugar biosynthesis glycosyltransferase [Hyphomonadaceae bacterium]